MVKSKKSTRRNNRTKKSRKMMRGGIFTMSRPIALPPLTPGVNAEKNNNHHNRNNLSGNNNCLPTQNNNNDAFLHERKNCRRFGDIETNKERRGRADAAAKRAAAKKH